MFALRATRLIKYNSLINFGLVELNVYSAPCFLTNIKILARTFLISYSNHKKV